MLKNPTSQTQKTERKPSRLRITSALPHWLPEKVRLRLLRHVSNAGGRLAYSFRFSRGERAALRHRKPVPVSEWSARHRILHMSAIPGRWHNDITPYLTGIMDASFFPGVEEIVQCKVPQSGGSEAVHNCIGYAADRRPGPTLYVFPDETTARENCTDRIIPMFEESPRLRELFTGKGEDRSAIRVNLSNMPVYMAWSGSATRLANKPICYLVLDELDKFQNPKKEASSEDLAEARTTTFARRRKIWKISSPSDAESPIWRNFQKAQAKFDYWVRCPDCGGEQLMQFDRIRWEGGTRANPEELKARNQATYVCEHCGSCWTDQTRNEAVKRGYWKARSSGLELFAHLKTHRPRSVGFHVPAWISRFVGLSEIAADFVEFMQAKALGKSIELVCCCEQTIENLVGFLFKGRSFFNRKEVLPVLVNDAGCNASCDESHAVELDVALVGHVVVCRGESVRFNTGKLGDNDLSALAPLGYFDALSLQVRDGKNGFLGECGHD